MEHCHLPWLWVLLSKILDGVMSHTPRVPVSDQNVILPRMHPNLNSARILQSRSLFDGRSHPGPTGRAPLVLALLLALALDQVRSLTPGRCGPSIAGGEPILLLKACKGESGGSVAENGDPGSPRWIE